MKVAGAKNATTKLLVASLLSDKKCMFYNVPNIGDVAITVNLCEEIGSEVKWDREKGILEIITRGLKLLIFPTAILEPIESPSFMIGALIGRTTTILLFRPWAAIRLENAR